MNSLPSACLAESAMRSASLRTFLGRSSAWLRTTGPKIVAPPRNCGERSEPARALPVPFCFHGFLVVPLISLTVLVLCVPAWALARCHSTMRCRISWRMATPKTASERSISPAALFSNVTTLTFITSSSLRLIRSSAAGCFRRFAGGLSCARPPDTALSDASLFSWRPSPARSRFQRPGRRL